VTVDLGFTHVALPVSDLDRSIAFYQRYAGFEVVHRRTDAEQGLPVAWLTDGLRPFVLVLVQHAVDGRLSGFAHLGVALESPAAVDLRCAEARLEGLAVQGPWDSPPPVGYWAFLEDPDGNHLELSYGQEVGLTLAGRRA